MKLNELRIGNLVLNAGCVWQISFKDLVFMCDTDNTIIDVYGKNVKLFEPILLTEEWLIKFGFQKISKGRTSSEFKLKIPNSNHFFNISSRDQYKTAKRPESHEYYFLTEPYPIFKYVHQIQNFYFALTQQELKETEKLKNEKRGLTENFLDLDMSVLLYSKLKAYFYDYNIEDITEKEFLSKRLCGKKMWREFVEFRGY